MILEDAQRSLIESQLSKPASDGFFRVKGSARNFFNPDTGELVSRRQFDKRFGVLAKQKFRSYEEKRDVRKRAGTPVHTKKFTGNGRIHYKYNWTGEQQQLDDLLRVHGWHTTNVYLEIEDSKGEQVTQTKVRDPRDNDAADKLNDAIEPLANKYTVRDTNSPDYNGPYTTYLIWSQRA